MKKKNFADNENLDGGPNFSANDGMVRYDVVPHDMAQDGVSMPLLSMK